MEGPEFIAQREENKNKRYKSSVSSSFNTRESQAGRFTLNTETENEEDEVEKVRPRRPMGRDQAKRRGKPGPSTPGVDVEVLPKLMNMQVSTTRTTSKRARTL